MSNFEDFFLGGGIFPAPTSSPRFQGANDFFFSSNSGNDTGLYPRNRSLPVLDGSGNFSADAVGLLAGLDTAPDTLARTDNLTQSVDWITLYSSISGTILPPVGQYYDPSDQLIYFIASNGTTGTSNYSLYKVDIATGVVTIIGIESLIDAGVTNALFQIYRDVEGSGNLHVLECRTMSSTARDTVTQHWEVTTGGTLIVNDQVKYDDTINSVKDVKPPLYFTKDKTLLLYAMYWADSVSVPSGPGIVYMLQRGGKHGKFEMPITTGMPWAPVTGDFSTGGYPAILGIDAVKFVWVNSATDPFERQGYSSLMERGSFDRFLQAVADAMGCPEGTAFTFA